MKQPNVIVFLTDQQRWDTAGTYGNPCQLTPVLDQMAQDGTCMESAFSPQPVCGPARGVLQTGKYATTVGTYRNAIPLSPEHRTMAYYFNNAGYRTGYIGKWHLGSTRHAVPKNERGGYQDWLGANALEATSLPYHTVVYDNDDRPVELPGYRVDALTDVAIRYINQKKDAPFFLFLSFLEPHFQNCWDSFPGPDTGRQITQPYIPPDLGALGGTSRQHLPGYYGMVARLDQALGRIRDALKSLNLSENTIVLFTSDHGCHFKTRNSEYKRSCHESSIHIPMVLTGGPFSSGGRIKAPVSLVDVAPTLMDACGIPIPNDMEGHSALPIVERKSQSWQKDIFIQISESQVGRALRTGRWKLAVEAPDKDPIQDSFSDRYTETAFYDLEQDPYELCNLAGLAAYRQVRQILSERLKQRILEIEKKDAQIILQEDRPSGQRTVFPGEELL